MSPAAATPTSVSRASVSSASVSRASVSSASPDPAAPLVPPLPTPAEPPEPADPAVMADPPEPLVSPGAPPPDPVSVPPEDPGLTPAPPPPAPVGACASGTKSSASPSAQAPKRTQKTAPIRQYLAPAIWPLDVRSTVPDHGICPDRGQNGVQRVYSGRTMFRLRGPIFTILALIAACGGKVIVDSNSGGGDQNSGSTPRAPT